MNIPTPSRKTLMVAGGIALLGVLAWLALRSPAQLASLGTVTRGPLEVSFQEEGKTRIKQRYVIAAPVAGTVRRITLQAGDAVQAGQTLVEMEPSASTLLDPRSRSQAQADVRSAQAQLHAARKRSAAAQASQQLAQADWQRAQSLHPSGAIARQELDQARARHDAAQAELGVARADEQAAAARLAAARATLADEGQAASAATAESGAGGKVLRITAPASGRVIQRPIESATPVPIGQTLMEIGDPTQLEIEVEVLSSDAVRLRNGMPARIMRWGGEGTLQARIARIEPGGFTKVSALGIEEQRTRVILHIESPREQWAALGDGYRVEAEFIVQRAEDVLQVPANALFRLGDGWAVYRLVNGKAQRTPVQVGMRSALAAEIKDGLQADQTVIIQPDDRISDGTRIQANQAGS